MTSTELPIACSLTDPEFQRRRQELLKTFETALLETKELEDGYGYRFPSDGDWIAELAQLITFERACCPFLRFNLRLEPANGPLWLELTGPEGTKDFLQSLFSSERGDETAATIREDH
jgi:hypothetical protein